MGQVQGESEHPTFLIGIGFLFSLKKGKPKNVNPVSPCYPKWSE